MIVVIIFFIAFILYVSVNVIYRKFWDKKLKVEVYLPSENVHEGERSNIKEIIINDKFLPLPILEIFFQLDKGLKYTDMANSAVSDKLYRRDVFAVGIKRKISRTFEIICQKRGYYKLEKIEMMSSDLFLMDKHLGSKSCFSSFYVYPRKVKSDRIATPFSRIMGDLLVKKKLYEDPFAFGGIRNYTMTDPMNRINWKATAKSQDLVVNMYDSSMNSNVFILLDTYGNRSVLAEDLNEESIRIASALVERLLVQGVEVNLETNGIDCRTKERIVLNDVRGLGISVIKQELAKLERVDQLSMDSLLKEVPKDTYVVLVSKNLELENIVKQNLEDFLWIIPYQYIKPQVEGIHNQYITWELESGDLTE
ncbi:MAG: DUF58 domain-containing protein [Eubacteriales bacterium]